MYSTKARAVKNRLEDAWKMLPRSRAKNSTFLKLPQKVKKNIETAQAENVGKTFLPEKNTYKQLNC